MKTRSATSFTGIFAAMLILIAGAFSPVHSQTPAPPPHAFGDGENLSYVVSFGAINIMRVSLRTIGENISGRPHYHIVGTGTTTGMARSFFSLNDTYHAWLDAGTLLPSRMTSDQHENDYHHRATYTYDWRARVVSTTRRNAKWNADRHGSLPLKPNSGDAVSLFFRLRQTDVATLEKGKAYPLDLVLDEKTRPIQFRFLGRESVKVRKIGTFDALKFTCTLATSDGTSFEGGMTLTVWISDDGNKIPLAIESPTRIGKIRATLSGGYKVLYPLTSLVE